MECRDQNRSSRILLCIVLLISPLTAHAQITQDWVQYFSDFGNGLDAAQDVAVDDAFNVYVTGHIYLIPNNNDFLTIKYDPFGNELWRATYNGPAHGSDFAVKLALDDERNVYVLGTSAGSGTNDDMVMIKYNSVGAELWTARYNHHANGRDVAVSFALSNDGVYIVGDGANWITTLKYDRDGVQQWAMQYDGPYNGIEYARAVAVDAANNVYVLGTSADATARTDFVTIKYNPAGNEQWVARYVNGTTAADLVLDNDGYIYVTGSGEPFDNYIHTIKYDANGQQLWATTGRVTPNFFYEKPRLVRVDGAGNVLVAGRGEGSSELYKFLVVKYDNSGAVQWYDSYAGAGLHDAVLTDLEIDAEDNIYVTGRDGLATSFPVFPPEIRYDVATIKYNSAGTREWVMRYSLSDTSRDFAEALTLDAYGNVYVAGHSAEDFMTIKYSVPAPELIATRVYLRTAPHAGSEVDAPQAGEQYYIHVDWRNAGATATTAGFRLQLLLNGNEYCAMDIGEALAKTWHAHSCATPVTWPEGGNTISAIVDPDGAIAEPIENNNSASRFYGQHSFGDFEFTAQVRSAENFNANNGADICFVYGFQDERHYYYVMLNHRSGDSRIYKITDSQRSLIGALSGYVIPDNEYHTVLLRRTGAVMEVYLDGTLLGTAQDGEYGAGALGLGSYNDAVFFDDICVRGLNSATCNFADDFESGTGVKWLPLHPSRWEVRADRGDNAYYLNTSSYSELYDLRLGEFALLAAPEGDSCLHNGDVNNDGILTPGDALCAFQIYLNAGGLPSGCDDPNNACELVAAEVNCDGQTTPGDALAIFQRYLQNLPPAECFAKPALNKSTAQQRITLQARQPVSRLGEEHIEELRVALVLQNPAGLSSFGMRLTYPADKLVFLGARRTALTSEWLQLDAAQRHEGELLLGGFHTQPLTVETSGETCELLFSIKNAAFDLSEFEVRDMSDDLSNAIFAHESSEQLQHEVPQVFMLHQSSPNPFRIGTKNNEAMIRFDLPGPAPAHVELTVYDVTGRLVRRLISSECAPGTYTTRWNGRNEHGAFVPSGTYVYRLQAGAHVTSRKLNVVR